MIQRVPCSKCGTLTLRQTAEANNGMCRPCNGALSPRTAERRTAFVDAFKAAVPQVQQRRADELQIQEEADWFGRTGLDDATERELPRYLRRELGEFLDDPEGLKASDLVYLGLFKLRKGQMHFWRIPGRTHGDSFAYIELSRDGSPTLFGWGDREPPARGDA
jgi:hypothetical protein